MHALIDTEAPARSRGASGDADPAHGRGLDARSATSRTLVGVGVGVGVGVVGVGVAHRPLNRNFVILNAARPGRRRRFAFGEEITRTRSDGRPKII